MNISFRNATEADIPFLLTAILESEKSGTDILSYSRLFGIDETQVCELIGNILDEEIEGQEWHLANFRILLADDQPAACLGAWVEGSPASGIIKAQAMSYFLGKLWADAVTRLQLAASVQIPRLAGALQMEHIYTAPAFRGRGLISLLINRVMEEFKTRAPETGIAEIQLMADNAAALCSYTKCGFLERARVTASDPGVLTLLPGGIRVSLTRPM